jgi:hypothetical protein
MPDTPHALPTDRTVRHRITELHPLATARREDCEAHYTHHHMPMIVRARRADAEPRVLRYRPHLTLSERVGGEWRDSLDYWRFVFVSYVGEGALGASGTKRISQDHTTWAQDLRSFEVTRTVLLDRRSGQLSSAKFLVLGHDDTGLSGDGLAADVVAWRNIVTDHGRSAFGMRLLIANDAITEQETEAIDVPGQRFTRRALPVHGVRYYDESYFDSAEAGVEFFTRPEVDAALPSGARLLRVVETIAFDQT